MNDVKYIMVSNVRNHWDKLSKWNDSTLFTLPMIKDGITSSPLPAEADTFFIKLTEENKFERCWIGKTKNFREDSYNGIPAIRFDVSGLKEAECPKDFLNYFNGWHLNKMSFGITPEPCSQDRNDHLQPPFFKEMAACNSLTFELHCFHLLRLLGIHDIYKFPQNNNRGKADGFFRFHTLSVIYDATLESQYRAKKETQIENYINQLKKEKISLDSISYTIKDTQRQVWIITRGHNIKLIKSEDNIKVKEVPYSKLIEIYFRRVHSEIGTDDLWDALKDLC
ncbi:MAG: hypothetical protein WCM76_15905 [Bacteroidota bacterium]